MQRGGADGVDMKPIVFKNREQLERYLRQWLTTIQK